MKVKGVHDAAILYAELHAHVSLIYHTHSRKRRRAWPSHEELCDDLLNMNDARLAARVGVECARNVELEV